ncbi:DA1-related protein 2 [Quillaja saponaria]|uniref:DA1-related protein 2 n=1 Tax=Quillaja saponaria TaxID=32244 RepID=A0AAD7PMJ1_QUISA|nr:DA1-related protein 2 [Quillaja saponaria]
MEWLSKLFQGGSNRGVGGRQLLAEENMVWRVPARSLIARNARYHILEDGRSLCLECMESAIMDTGDCQPLYHAIRDYYEGMNMRLDQQIPMLLVERQALNEAIVGEKHGFHHLPETRGLCLSEEQTVTSILRRPRIGGHRLVGMRTQPQKLTQRCEVIAILVLYCLPRLLQS